MRYTGAEWSANGISRLSTVQMVRSALLVMIGIRPGSLTVADFRVKSAIFVALPPELGVALSSEPDRFPVQKAELLMISAIAKLDAPVLYRQNKHVLFGQQAAWGNGCRSEFPFRALEVDHIIRRGSSGQDNIENLQLLCPHCNRVKGDRPQEYQVARPLDVGIVA